MLGDGLRDTLDPADEQTPVTRRCSTFRALRVDRCRPARSALHAVSRRELHGEPRARSSASSANPDRARASSRTRPWASCRRRSPRRRARCCSSGENVLARERGATARAALHAHGDDLPGADDRAQSGHALRRPDRRGARDAHEARRRRSGARRCAEIVRAVHLPDPARMIASYPHQLSGGQRQRIMIAMSLVLEPVAPHRRRAHHRARRDHAGADPRAHPRAHARARHRRAVHHARLRRRRRDRRSRGRAAPRRARGGGSDAARCSPLRRTSTRRC